MMSYARPKTSSAPAARRRQTELGGSLSPRREARQESSSSSEQPPRPAQLPWRRREELRKEAQALEDPEGAMQNGGSTASTAGAISEQRRSPSEASSRAEPALHKAPPESTDDISGFCIGEKVRYWSATHAKWVDAHVQRVYRAPDGEVVSYDLTKKAQAEIWRVRDASTPEDAPAPVEESAAPVSLSRGFQLEQQVQYFSETKEKWIDATVELKYEKDGVLTYDLNCKTCVPEDRVRSANVSYSVGEDVEYWSSSVRRWVQAKVLRLNLEAKQCDLTIKPGALLSRVRKATGITVGERIADAPRHSAGMPLGVAAPAPPLSCSFKAGDQVQYYSESKLKWIETVVERMFDQDGSICYDLGCKKGVSADKVRASLKASQDNYKVGELVEYWSITSGRWLPAKVEAFFPELGHCHLDIKLQAPVGRIRHRASVAPVLSDAPVPAPVAEPAVPAPSGEVDVTDEGRQHQEGPAAAAPSEEGPSAAAAVAAVAAAAEAAPSEEGQAAAPSAEVNAAMEDLPAATPATAQQAEAQQQQPPAEADGQVGMELTPQAAPRERRRRRRKGGSEGEGGERKPRKKRRRQHGGSGSKVEAEASLKPNGHRDETRVDNSLVDAAEHAIADPKWQELATAQAEAMQTDGERPSHEQSDSLHKQQGVPTEDDPSDRDRQQEEEQQQQLQTAADHVHNASRESGKPLSSAEAGSSDEGTLDEEQHQHRPNEAGRPESATEEPELQASERLQSSRDEPASQQHPSLTEVQSVEDRFAGLNSRPVESDARSSREEQQVRAGPDLSDSDDSDAPGWRRQAPRSRQDLSEDSKPKTGPTALEQGAMRPSQERKHAQNESESSESESLPSNKQALSAGDTAATPGFPNKRANRRDGAVASGRRRKSRKVADNANKKPHAKAMPKPANQRTPEALEQQRSPRTAMHRRDRSADGRDRQRASKEEPRGSMEDSNRDERQHPWRDTAEASDHKQPLKLTSRDFSENGERDWQRSAKTGLHGRPDRSEPMRQQQSSRDRPRGRDGAREVRDFRDTRDMRDVRNGSDTAGRQWSAKDQPGRFVNAPWRETSDQGRSCLRLRSRSMFRSRSNRNRLPLKRIRSRSRGSPPQTRRGHSRPRHDTRVRKPRK